MNNTKTAKLYQEDVYATTEEAHVLDCLYDDTGRWIVLDRTIFYPEGGGQPSDTGQIDDIPIDYVKETDGIIYHKAAENVKLPEIGQTVKCEIDWARRCENMQRHLGEHILSGTFMDMYGGANRGFHMGEDYVTVDIRLENDPSFETIDMDMALAAEERINDVIFSGLPVHTDIFHDADKARKMPLRKELDIEGENISIVTVGDMDSPVDCVACCGTHPKNTSEVGLLKIYKVEKNKDMFRIYFDCGIKALADYREKHRIITDICDKHSAGILDIEKKMTAEEEKNRKARAHLGTLAGALAAVRADEILQSAKTAPEHVCFRSYNDMNADDIMRIGKIIGPELKKPALILSENEHTVLLFSDGTIHCGNLVRENAGIYGGKGGGSDVQARAIFPDNANIDTFVDLIDKHLR